MCRWTGLDVFKGQPCFGECLKPARVSSCHQATKQGIKLIQIAMLDDHYVDGQAPVRSVFEKSVPV